jgi:hypothetical protein
MKKLSLLFIPLFSVFVFLSCSNSIVFDEKVVFQNDNWAFEEKAQTFEVPFKASEKPYAIVLELELTGTPNVDKFNASFTLVTPKGGKTIKSLVFNFVNPKEPYLKGASPKEKIYRLTVYSKRYFSETGTYTIEVNQASTNADNYNIHALRLYIEKVK